MSFIDTFNYNRDNITSGSVAGFTGAPIYGSSVTFTCDNSSWRGSNYNNFLMPRGLNSIKAEMDLTFQGNVANMKSILRRIENATTGTLTGDIAFSGTDDCINFGESKNGVQINLDTDYYRNFSGSQVSNYAVKHISSDVYELNVSMFNNRVSPVLNNGMGFVADNTVSIGGSSFLEFDVATGSTSSANSEIFNNYFYLTGSRGSSISASNVSGLATYTGFADDATRTFFWEPDQQVSVPVSHGARINQFKKSFHQQLNISKNQNRIDQLQLRFSNRGQRETYAILHFLESHLGYKNFVYYYDDPIINQNRVFYCPQWRHTFNYKDSNTIEATFIEIVAPVIPFGNGGGGGGGGGTFGSVYPGTQIVVANSSLSFYNDTYTYNGTNQRYEKSTSTAYYFYRDTDANQTWKFVYAGNTKSETSPGNNDFGETAWSFTPFISPATLTIS